MNILELLNKKVSEYNNPKFIESDPISIPHQFKNQKDIEISGYLTSIISWGRRAAILNSANKLMKIMDHKPYDFIMNAGKSELKGIDNFVYRTFNADDCYFALEAMKNLYVKYDSMEVLANELFKENNDIKDVIIGIRKELLSTEHLKRSQKHFANPETGSAAKRTNMFLRWMIRQDNKGVDFGLWKNIPASALMIPLDVHSGNTARALGLLERKQNDWRAVEELSKRLKEYDKNDPVKYDFALFGIGVFEGKIFDTNY